MQNLGVVLLDLLLLRAQWVLQGLTGHPTKETTF